MNAKTKPPCADTVSIEVPSYMLNRDSLDAFKDYLEKELNGVSRTGTKSTEEELLDFVNAIEKDQAARAALPERVVQQIKEAREYLQGGTAYDIPISTNNTDHLLLLIWIFKAQLSRVEAQLKQQRDR